MMEMPEKFTFRCACICFMKENNKVMFKKYYEYKNNSRDLALSKKNLYQLVDSKPITVGC
ncbi:hypothetical protein A6V39_01915 [Candidatus Mycoplasma haematobovis]|uniref:Uncharacterized protein n=1 Tax=Candidatus Mycoplasma haematobovis TaxID=432608 RepID=A0A1A9QE03_9MOLU|nr:hypothetical protein A6V39_01915 [Candidatus Mycoplasma haematobovis]